MSNARVARALPQTIPGIELAAKFSGKDPRLKDGGPSVNSHARLGRKKTRLRAGLLRDARLLAAAGVVPFFGSTPYAPPVKRALRPIGLLVALLVVFLAGAAAVAALVGALGLTAHVAAGIGWAAGAGVALAAWRLWRAAIRKRRAARVARDRTAGEELRREDRSRYAQLLEGEADTLVFTDPDLYAGQQLSASVPTKAADGKRRFRLGCAPAWQPPTTGQRETIDELTEELERATLVRSLDDGSAEVVGVKNCVGFAISSTARARRRLSRPTAIARVDQILRAEEVSGGVDGHLRLSQETASRSTTNTSGSCGAMTPPAPRAP